MGRYKTNELIIKKDHGELIIKSADGAKQWVAMLDLDDIDIVRGHSWCIRSKGYVGRVKKGKLILLHRELMKCPDDKVVDHINRNKLDNRKGNLRICSVAENLQNGSIRERNDARVIGVTVDSKTKKWRARIYVDGKSKSLGFFESKDEAIEARLVAEREYFNDFAPQRDLFEEYGI